MALVTANGIGVVAADFVLPISRAWYVDMTVATADPSQINGKVSISINGGALTMNGTAKVEDVYLDTARARVVAGAAGLMNTADPKFYRQAPVKLVLNDLMATAGETLSSTADAALLATTLNAWTVSQMPVADAIDLVMRHVGGSWRMLADGTLWCGSETWPDSGLDFTLEHEDKAHSQVIVSMESPLLLPGYTLGGRKVSYVETHVDANTVKSTASLVTDRSTDRMRDPMVAMTRSAVSGIDMLALYRSKVVAQSADLDTVDVIPDDPRLSQDGAQSIPLLLGFPGCKVQFSPGAYVLLGWKNADPSVPYCTLWEGGAVVQSIQLGGNTPVARKGDHSGGGSLVFAFVPGSGAASLSVTYTDPDGNVTTLASGTGTVPLKAKLTEGSSIVGAG